MPKHQEASAFAIYCHCFTCGKNISAASRISKRLAEHGIACLRFDFRGNGESEGVFADHNYSSSIEDILACNQYLTDNFQAPGLLIGHSFGGIASLGACQYLPSVKAVISIASPSHPSHILGHFSCQVDEILKNGHAEVEIMGKKLQLSKGFIDDINKAEPLKDLKKVKKAFLIFHSPLDETVGIESASEIFTALKHPKSFVSLDYADHLITKKSDAEYVADICYQLGKRYLKNG